MKKILIADVSHWNKVDFNELKKNGVEGVIIKAGEYSLQEGTFAVDKMFEEHYSRAIAAGMLCGAYYYSKAKDSIIAEKEAMLFLRAVQNKTWLLPLVGDFEFARYNGNTLNSIIHAAAQAIEKMNYYFMAYMDKDNFGRYRNYAGDYAVWIADWDKKTEWEKYSNFIKMHQYTSRGENWEGKKIVNYDLDISIMLYNIPKAIMENALFGPEFSMKDVSEKLWKNFILTLYKTELKWKEW